jgi:hypothetical protein
LADSATPNVVVPDPGAPTTLMRRYGTLFMNRAKVKSGVSHRDFRGE